MRPFFLLTMGSAVLLIALWSAVLALGLPPPPVAGGALVWHAHELLLGFGLPLLLYVAIAIIAD